MAKLFKHIIYILCITLGFFSLLAQDKVALHIYFHDDGALLKSYSFYYEQLFKELHPEIEFLRVEIPLEESPIRQRITDALATIQSQKFEIEYLILDTHGRTSEIGDRSFTSLKGLGYFGDSGPDIMFDFNLSPVRTVTSKSLKILMNACSTFCGEPEDILKRSSALLHYLRAPNGSIYGAKTKEVSDLFTDSRFHKFKYLKPTPDFLMKVITYPGMAGVANLIFYQLLSSQSFLESTIQSTISALMAAGFMIVRDIRSRTSKDATFNKGFYLKFKNSRLDKAWHVDKYKELKEMVGEKLSRLACDFNFL